MTNLHIERTGAGRPFVWGHGMTSSIAAQRAAGLFQWTGLPAIELIEYDACGHGRSSPVYDDDRYLWPRLAQDMLDVADAAGAESFVAGGASMGCATALLVALTAPARLEALVLAIPPTAWETRAGRAAAIAGEVERLERGGVAALVESERALPLEPPWSARFREAHLASLAAMDARALAHILRASARSDLPPEEQVAGIAAPTLILAWEGDRGHPMSTALALHELIPGSRLEVAADEADVAAWPGVVGAFVGSL